MYIYVHVYMFVYFSKEELFTFMWPEGKQHITETTKRPQTAGTNFKNSIIALVENLATKVIFVILVRDMPCLNKIKISKKMNM